jgi:cation-transporting ATPase 13A1
MFYGILGVTGLAFVCSLELAPEINQQMKLVPFSDEFKYTMTTVMVIDYGACWLIEIILKALFSDFRPRDIAARRPDQLEREKKRKEELEVKKAEEAQKKIEEEEAKEAEKIAELERKIAARQAGQRA